MDSFIGEIRVFGFGFVPEGWASCNGQEMLVDQQQELYSIIGNAFGGTPGRSFALPNLQGLATMGTGTGTGLTKRILGEQIGKSEVTLSTSQIPSHTHSMHALRPTFPFTEQNLTATPGTNTQIFDKIKKTDSGYSIYLSFSPTMDPENATALHSATVGITGQGDSHENRQPYLSMNYCISLTGVYPVRPH